MPLYVHCLRVVYVFEGRGRGKGMDLAEPTGIHVVVKLTRILKMPGGFFVMVKKIMVKSRLCKMLRQHSFFLETVLTCKRS